MMSLGDRKADRRKVRRSKIYNSALSWGMITYGRGVTIKSRACNGTC